MTTVDDDERASGDLSSVKIKPEPEPEPVKIPDVELVVDGFGFMPVHRQNSRRRSSLFDKMRGRPEETRPEQAPQEAVGEEGSPCASSTNIDVVRRYTWKTKNRMTVQLISYGATFTSIQVPDKRGNPDDILGGFDTLEEYYNTQNPYFGAVIGRYANYIAEGTMVVRPSGRMYMLSMNKGHHHYNGGYVGFDKVNWRSYVTGNKVIMSHVSERFSEGYPGTLMTQIVFEVTCDNTIKMDIKCTTSEPTIVNISHAPFFNLAGHHAGNQAVYDHIFTINGDKYTPTTDDGLVTGEKKVVGGTPYDFRVPRLLRIMLPKIPRGGYDVNYCITQGTEQELTFQARAVHPVTGRVVEVYSNQPGLQFYTGNLLPDPDRIVEDDDAEEEDQSDSVSSVSGEGEHSDKSEKVAEEEKEGIVGFRYIPLPGKGGTCYKKHGLFALMPQNYPDAVNNKNFPRSVLNPGEVYNHRIQYKFGLLLGRYV